ncbi:DTW domain-containing protein [Mortierella sp. GBAus27b]|nr:hypothetical protein BGX31_008756 [Mortierella sp. GBA43]KAI8350458.1 DTW domain-containing protein [Mortierella sp. GBAus27b]
MPGSVQLSDLPDDILLRIFSCFVVEQVTGTEWSKPFQQADDDTPTRDTAASVPSTDASGSSGKRPPKTRRGNRNAWVRVAGSGVRTLCRLCCCCARLNHLASADQLWQPLTLARFPDRHWLTTDQNRLELVDLQRERQLKVAKARESKKEQEERADLDDSNDVPPTGTEDHKDSQEGDGDKVEKRTFYSRFEQRAFRRKFGSLDPELKYTPLIWTNTLWTWKRTFFGDYRFVGAKDVATPNRIDHALHRKDADSARQECERCWRPTRSCLCSTLTTRQYCNCRTRIMILQHPKCHVSIGTIRILKLSFKYCQIVIGKDFKAGRSLELDQALDDPNCTPLLLYPSHSAIDIHSFSSAILDPAVDSNESPDATKSRSRYTCQGCTHGEEDGSQLLSSDTTPESYPYRLIIALDGSWSHAKIMYRCNPRLQQLTQIKFPQPPQSIYHELKPEPKVTYTSTAEAVGQAVALLGWPSPSGAATATVEPSSDSLTDAQLLLEDLIRPLKRLIGIQHAMYKETLKQDGADHEQEEDEPEGPSATTSVHNTAGNIV